MSTSRPSSPFADVRPAFGVAAGYAVALVVWLLAGDGLPGGRWFAVHLFTLGVLSNLVLALTQHFADTLLHRPATARVTARMLLFNAGALAVLIGLPTGITPLLVAGATATSAAVLWLYVTLRRARKQSPSQRFGFVVRTYERATSAFLHGALLGGLVGSGVLPGTWAGAARTAHLHILVLGWGGLTLLATLVLFGPTVLRARMQPGADAAAAVWLRRGATGLTVGVLALVGSGLGGTGGTALRLLAAAGLAVYAGGVVAVCLPVLRAARTARRPGNGLLLSAACVWFPVAVVGDALVVATASWRLLTPLGVLLLIGVLAQAILGSAGYVGPMLVASGGERAVVRARLDALPWLRVALVNAAVLALVAAAVVDNGVVARAGWVLLIAAVVAHLSALLLPPQGGTA